MQRSALCRSRRELSNAYLLAEFRFDTAETEPSKVYAVLLHGALRYFRAACWLGLLLGCYAGIRAAASAAGVPSDLRAKHPVDLVADVQVIMLLGTLQGWAVDI